MKPGKYFVCLSMAIFVYLWMANGLSCVALRGEGGGSGIRSIVDSIEQKGRLSKILARYIFGDPEVICCDGLEAYAHQMDYLLNTRAYFFVPTVSPRDMLEDIDLLKVLPFFFENYEKKSFVRATGDLAVGVYNSLFTLLLQSVNKSLMFSKSWLISGLLDNQILLSDCGEWRLNDIDEIQNILQQNKSLYHLFEWLSDYLMVVSFFDSAQDKEIAILREAHGMLASLYKKFRLPVRVFRIAYLQDFSPKEDCWVLPSDFMTREARDGAIDKAIGELGASLPRILKNYIFGVEFNDQVCDISFYRSALENCVQYRCWGQVPIVSLDVMVADLELLKTLSLFYKNYKQQALGVPKSLIFSEAHDFMSLLSQAVRKSLFAAKDWLDSYFLARGMWIANVGEEQRLVSPRVLRSIVGGDWVVASAFKTLQNYLKILSVLVPPHIDGCNLLRATYAALECTYNELRISPQFVDEQYFCHRELDCRSCLDCYAGDSNDPFEELAKTVLDDSAEDMLDAVTPESPASKASTEGAFRTQGQS